MWNKVLAVLIIIFAIVSVIGLYKFDYTILMISTTITMGAGYIAVMIFGHVNKAIAAVIVAIFLLSYFTISNYKTVVDAVMLLFMSSLFASKLWRKRV